MDDIRLLREAAVLTMAGTSRTGLHDARRKKVFVDPVPIGGRTVGYPSNEVQAIIKARIAGKSDDEVRALVESLHSARRELA